ncbi:uncharacterized mitochondrial protein AtMg00810-like [Hibiscus syriacus]|uniref:uncharacterized mitochondrial protein AtMg00810-like n=1 Tax=Hibiscus syriacus TaxID=106335 RepID=UPI0019210E29|nr:uncharacterized mitochondrial protein AtMg00810-like [Hibiscus syriacus]
MKDLGAVKYLLGFEVFRSKEGILLSQRKYALELIRDTSRGGAKPVATPMEQRLKFTTVEYDEVLGTKKGSQQIENEVLGTENGVFQWLIQRLPYLTHTRSDIMYVVHHLSLFLQHPKRSHLEAAMRIFKYVKKTSGQRILLRSSGYVQLEAYCDANCGSCLMARRSITGYCIKICGSLVS